MLKRLISAVFLLALVFETTLAAPSYAALPTITDPPISPAQPPVVVTEFGGGLPDFFELYNQSDQPISLEGWKITFTVIGEDIATGQTIEESHVINLPSAWLLSEQYHMWQHSAGSGSTVSAYTIATALQNPQLTSLSIVDANGTGSYTVTPTVPLNGAEWVQHKQRTKSSLKVSGAFTTDYTVHTTDPTGFSDALYTPPAAVVLRIVEILPNARDCSPVEATPECGDYVKLYNPTTTNVDGSLYRLRTDSGGTKSSSSNTFSLPSVMAPQEYTVVNLKDNAELLSITNTGGYVWLEDAEGVHTYQASVVAYPDASATAHKGLSWALDTVSGIWKWMPPAPQGPNYWPPDTEGRGAEENIATLADCGPGRERNPATNRCRNIASTTSSTLTPCKAGQERNPETNRCRSVLGASTSLTPCDKGQYRNPETNRCKSIESVSSLTPCKPGYERNPDTNRCKKIPLTGKDIPAVKDVESKTKASTISWWLVGGAIAAAMAYGVYEWRNDIARRFKWLK